MSSFLWYCLPSSNWVRQQVIVDWKPTRVSKAKIREISQERSQQEREAPA